LVLVRVYRVGYWSLMVCISDGVRVGSVQIDRCSRCRSSISARRKGLNDLLVISVLFKEKKDARSNAFLESIHMEDAPTSVGEWEGLL